MALVVPGYQVLKELGEGGMGVVYLAREESLDTLVAIKLLHRQFTAKEQVRERFKNEARMMVSLVHTNIVQFRQFLSLPEGLALVMEYVEGRGLDRMIGEEFGPIPWEKAIPIFTQILNGLGYAHSKGIIHRDIKPSNIIVSDSGEVKITDFGIAKIAGQGNLTKTGMQMGTLYYESPEQIMGAGNVDQRADIYSLGMTLFEMLAGRLPFDDEQDTSEYRIMDAIVKREEELDPRIYYPHVPEWLVRVVQKATALDPDMRFGDCNSFLDALRSRIADQETQQIRIDHSSDQTRTLRDLNADLVGPKRGKVNAKPIIVSSLAGAVIVFILLQGNIIQCSKHHDANRIDTLQAASSSSSSQLFQCPFCEEDFTNESLLGNHILEQHGRFHIINDFIKDYYTGLSWRVGPDRHMSWIEASNWVNGLSGSWRMPTLDELEGLHTAGITVGSWGLFANSGYGVWSSEMSGNESAWFFNFPDGSRQVRPIEHPDYKVVFAVR